jgi:hypothetical protein
MITTRTTQCLNCERSLMGRADKKFCSDQCRNDYNNKQKYSSNNLIRNINNILRKNRRIMEEFFDANPDKETVTVPKMKLTDAGFSFKYLTHRYTTKKGTIYYYCYDYGYFLLENDWYLLVRRKEE